MLHSCINELLVTFRCHISYMYTQNKYKQHMYMYSIKLCFYKEWNLWVKMSLNGYRRLIFVCLFDMLSVGSDNLTISQMLLLCDLFLSIILQYSQMLLLCDLFLSTILQYSQMLLLCDLFLSTILQHSQMLVLFNLFLSII